MVSVSLFSLIGSKLGQKVKGQGHRVTKCKKWIHWPELDMHSIECSSSSVLLISGLVKLPLINTLLSP